MGGDDLDYPVCDVFCNVDNTWGDGDHIVSGEDDRERERGVVRSFFDGCSHDDNDRILVCLDSGQLKLIQAVLDDIYRQVQCLAELFYLFFVRIGYSDPAVTLESFDGPEFWLLSGVFVDFDHNLDILVYCFCYSAV